MQDVVEKIKSSVKISDIISRRIKIKPNGHGRFSASCPFHNEKTASFKIDDTRGIYKCFGCGAGGDMFKFIQDYDRLPDFKSSLNVLSDITGIEIIFDAKEKERYDNIKELYKINQSACEFFISKLAKSNSTKDYIINKRKIDNDNIEKFKIGYAPDSYRDLINFLIKEGYSEDDILKAGLAKKSDAGKVYSIFRNRLIIPIFDQSKRCIAFGGRVLSDKDEPKYINSFETEIFKKGHTLYNIDKISNVRSNAIIISEGYMDVIALSKAGFYAVAPLGTSITNEQINILHKFQSKIIFWLDSDNAGIKSGLKAAEMILKSDIFIDTKFILNKNAKDPDEYLNEFGKDALENIVKHPMEMHEFLWLDIAKDIDFHNPNDINKVHIRINQICENIQNKSIRKEYTYYFKSQIYKSKFIKTNINIDKPIVKQNTHTKIYTIERMMIECLINNKNLIENENFDIEFINSDLSNILHKIIAEEDYKNYYNSLNTITIPNNNEKFFLRLCISHKIEVLDEEIVKIKNTKPNNFIEILRIYAQERKMLIEKLENYIF